MSLILPSNSAVGQGSSGSQRCLRLVPFWLLACRRHRSQECQGTLKIPVNGRVVCQRAGLLRNELVTPGTPLTDTPWWNRGKKGPTCSEILLHLSSQLLAGRKGVSPANNLNILWISSSSIMCSGTVHELFFSMSHFSSHSREVDLFICMFCESNDAAGHNRRWHLLLMVTPAHGRPCGQAPGRGKLGREDREYGGRRKRRRRSRGRHYCHRGSSKWKCLSCFLIIHANLKSRSELKPRRLGRSFFFFF